MNVRASELFTSYGQVSSLIQPIRNVIKGHSFLSMFKDGLIEEQLIVGVMIASESRGTTGEGKVEGQVSWGKYPPTPSFCYGGVILKNL